MKKYQFAELGIKEPRPQSSELFNIKKTKTYKVNNFLYANELTAVKNIINPRANYKTIYLHLDTNNMVYREDGKLSWDLTESNRYLEGVVNIQRPIKNIVGMRLMPFRMIEANSTFTKDHIYRWSILIDELQNDSFKATNNFHFITTGTKVNSVADAESDNYIEMTMANFNRGYYWFNYPVYSISSLTFSFSNILNRFNMPNQISKWLVEQTSNPMHLTPVFVIAPYEIKTEDIIITGFTTGDTATDSAVIDSVEGQVLTVTSASATDIYIGAIDLSSTTSTGGDLYVYVKSYRYRTILSLELITDFVEED